MITFLLCMTAPNEGLPDGLVKIAVIADAVIICTIIVCITIYNTFHK